MSSIATISHYKNEIPILNFSSAPIGAIRRMITKMLEAKVNMLNSNYMAVSKTPKLSPKEILAQVKDKISHALPFDLTEAQKKRRDMIFSEISAYYEREAPVQCFIALTIGKRSVFAAFGTAPEKKSLLRKKTLSLNSVVIAIDSQSQSGDSPVQSFKSKGTIVHSKGFTMTRS